MKTSKKTSKRKVTSTKPTLRTVLYTKFTDEIWFRMTDENIIRWDFEYQFKMIMDDMLSKVTRGQVELLNPEAPNEKA